MTVHDNNTYVPPTGSHQSPATKNTDTCIRHPRQSRMFKMPRLILPSTSASGTRHRVRTAQRAAILPCYAYTKTPLNNDLPSSRKPWRGNHTPMRLRQSTNRTFLIIQSSVRPRAHDYGPTQRRSNLPMLAGLLFKEETYSGPRQGLRSSRYIRTVKLLNDG